MKLINKKFAGAILLGLSFTGLGIYAGNLQTTPDTPESSAVRQVMSKKFPDSNGLRQSLSSWKNQLLVVNFWATWCAPCVQEMPELSALQHELSGKPVQIVGLGIDSPSNISEFAKKYSISYPLLVAGLEGSELSRQLGNLAGGLPFTVLITPDGKVAKSYLGRLKMDALRADIAKFSAEKSK
ncbi:TlpA family protein disulfide reductase [Undibacterium griseum]|uniref:TlpA family protein disulfide reductase n=2 Tax=Pseudomonadota TaxID=1224 RepID=A0ABR6YK26_9BURK|nr:TlpA disulfide reductase family protein [Undibacterium griseum]MBC3884219.1 TlpA family protein disulfide reductase [Undibacterium griseum]